MGKIIQRGIMPILLLAGGVAALGYGVKYHIRPVFVEQEIEISLAPPQLPPMAPGAGPPGFGPPPGFGGPPGGMSPFGAAPPELQKVKQKVLVGQDDLELALVRDVTIGGLVLLGSGEMKRTYSGQPPSLCPT